MRDHNTALLYATLPRVYTTPEMDWRSEAIIVQLLLFCGSTSEEEARASGLF